MAKIRKKGSSSKNRSLRGYVQNTMLWSISVNSLQELPW